MNIAKIQNGDTPSNKDTVNQTSMVAMPECIEEQTNESNSRKATEENRAVDNMEKKHQLNGKICEAVLRISGVTLDSFTCQCLADHLTVTFCSLDSLALQSAISLGYYKQTRKYHTLLDSSQTTAM